MKIIAVHPVDRSYLVPGAIVELQPHELQAILSESDHSLHAHLIRPGNTVEIAKRWHHLREIESQVQEATKLPAKLRTLADMLEMNVPAIVDLTKPPPDPELI